MAAEIERRLGLAERLARCIEDPRTDGGVFNLGSGVNHSVREIFDAVQRLLASEISPIFTSRSAMPLPIPGTSSSSSAVRSAAGRGRPSITSAAR